MKQFWGALLLAGSVLGGFEAKAQNPYPPSGFIRIGSQVSLELRQSWTSTVSGKDVDGDWTGDVRGANGTVGKFFALALNGGAFRFQVAYSGASEFCDLTGTNSVINSSANSVTYSGNRAFKQGAGVITSDNTTCRVVVSNAASPVIQQPVQPVQPIQPPTLPSTQAQLPALTFPPRLEVGQRWEIRLGNRAIVYRGVLNSLDSARNVYIGTLTTDGIGDPIAQRKFEVFFAQNTLAMYATDPQGGTTVCSFAGAGTLQNNVLTGTVFFKTATETQFRSLTAVQDAPCKANLEPVQQAVQPVSPIQPVQPVQPVQPPAQNLTPSLPARVGDTWRIVANGNLGLDPWVLTFSRTDTDGTLVGTASQGNGRGEANGLKTTDGGYAFVMEVNNRVIACLTVANTPVVNGGFLGQLVEIAQNQAKSLNTSCTLTLTSRGGTTSTVVTPPVQSLAAAFPPKVGQTWTITIEGLSPWVVLFQDLNKDNELSGTGLQNGLARRVLAYLNNGLKIFAMAGENDVIYYCAFAANIQAVGATLSGGVAYQEPKGAQQPTAMNRSCSATLTAQQLLLGAGQQLETRGASWLPSFLKLSPLF